MKKEEKGQLSSFALTSLIKIIILSSSILSE